jgi:hypothetical protein
MPTRSLLGQILNRTPWEVQHADEQDAEKRKFDKQTRLDELTTASKLRKEEEADRLAAARDDIKQKELHMREMLVSSYGPEKGAAMFNDIIGQPGYLAHKENVVNQLAAAGTEARIPGEGELAVVNQNADKEAAKARGIIANTAGLTSLATDPKKVGHSITNAAELTSANALLNSAVADKTDPNALAAAANTGAQVQTAANNTLLRPFTVNNTGAAAAAKLPPITDTGAGLQALGNLLPSAQKEEQAAYLGGRTLTEEQKAALAKQQADMMSGILGGTTATPTTMLGNPLQSLTTGTSATSSNVPGPVITTAPNSTSGLGTGEKAFDPKQGPAGKFFKPKK